MAEGQEAVSSITQSRLFAIPSAPATSSTDALDTAPADEAATGSGDDSFGTQIILKSQQQPRPFTVFSDVSLFYTNNVDLTPDHTRSDAFLIANVGGAWRPMISRELLAEVVAATSAFRYNRASELDFERISAGTGLTWIVPRARGIVAFGRYDFTEVIDSGGNELLQDHAFTVGAQKAFVLGRSHFLTTGITGVIGISAPRSQERDQAGIHAGYHLQLTRSLGGHLLYRYAAQFYSEDDRVDHNQTFSVVLGYSANRWLRVEGVVSAARNDSNRPGLSYEAVNVGVGLKAGIKF